MKFKVGDIVKGTSPYPFDVRGDLWTVMDVIEHRLGKPCTLKRQIDGVCSLPIPSDMLELVRRPRSNGKDRIDRLEKKIQQLENHIRQLERNQ